MQSWGLGALSPHKRSTQGTLDRKQRCRARPRPPTLRKATGTRLASIGRLRTALTVLPLEEFSPSKLHLVALRQPSASSHLRFQETPCCTGGSCRRRLPFRFQTHDSSHKQDEDRRTKSGRSRLQHLAAGHGLRLRAPALPAEACHSC